MNRFLTSLNSINKKVRHVLVLKADHIHYPKIYEYVYLKYLCLYVDIILFPYKKLYTIPWNIIVLKSTFLIENNYPHTHLDTIYVSQLFFALPFSDQLSILIHEKIHIYQRYNPIAYHKILQSYDINIHSLASYHPYYKNSRRNPDLNNIIYHQHNSYNIQVFNINPNSLADSTIKNFPNTHKGSSPFLSYEHPNEFIAYTLTEQVLNNNVSLNLQKYL